MRVTYESSQHAGVAGAEAEPRAVLREGLDQGGLSCRERDASGVMRGRRRRRVACPCVVGVMEACWCACVALSVGQWRPVGREPWRGLQGLFDDELALELGAPTLAAIPDVFVSADGPKKSISGPGIGNYVTFAKSAALLKNLLGDRRFASGGMVQAHGTSTPQNRVTESQIMSQVAVAMGVQKWRVGAIKSFIGHSLGAAAGDQLSAMLGVWETGLMPGITTLDGIASDVATDRLEFALRTEATEAPDSQT